MTNVNTLDPLLDVSFTVAVPAGADEAIWNVAWRVFSPLHTLLNVKPGQVVDRNVSAPHSETSSTLTFTMAPWIPLEGITDIGKEAFDASDTAGWSTDADTPFSEFGKALFNETFAASLTANL
jgi:hypothetical protein